MSSRETALRAIRVTRFRSCAAIGARRHGSHVRSPATMPALLPPSAAAKKRISLWRQGVPRKKLSLPPRRSSHENPTPDCYVSKEYPAIWSWGPRPDHFLFFFNLFVADSARGNPPLYPLKWREISFFFPSRGPAFPRYQLLWFISTQVKKRSGRICSLEGVQ